MREIRDVTVGELMSKPPVTVTLETSIADLRRLMAEYDVNGFPVVSDVGAPFPWSRTRRPASPSSAS